jgi:hypothetical protein
MKNSHMLHKILILLLTLSLTFLHLVYAFKGGYYLYGLSGGITQHGKWTQFGGSPYAWTIPIQLPGSAVMAIGLNIGHSPPLFGALGLLLELSGSVATSYAMASVLAAFMMGKRPNLGRYGWKVTVIVLGLIWIPVPENFASIYMFTVAY